jgi:hypothetical protein
LSLISFIPVAQAARAVVAADGLKGLFGRGLKTRIIANGLQGLLFSVLWKLFLDLYVPSPKLHWKAHSYVVTQLGFEDWKLALDLVVCLCTSQLQILNPTMSDPNFTVSLKASPFPYGIVALAQFVDVPVAYEETTKDDLALVRDGAFVTDPAEIISVLASQGAPEGGSSKVHVIHQVQDGEADAQLDQQTHALLAKANVLRTSTGFQDAVAIFDDLDDHLAFRTFFASHTLGVVDLAIWGAIKGAQCPFWSLVTKEHDDRTIQEALPLLESSSVVLMSTSFDGTIIWKACPSHSESSLRSTQPSRRKQYVVPWCTCNAT